MSTYAVGDVQGCMEALYRLLDKVNFNKTHDCLWFVGDLVNRGPDSLAVLRFVKQLESSAVVVLGNHDLHLLAVWAGVIPSNRKDTLQDVLTASDTDELLTWLRFRPLIHHEKGHVMIHAGLLPSWSVSQAMDLAHEAEAALQHNSFQTYLPSLYFRNVRVSSSAPSEEERLGLTANVLTRLRVCTKDGIPDFSFKGPPEEAPAGYFPWFKVPNRAAEHSTIIFGHWSALGIVKEQYVCAIDGGCVWGQELVALRLEDHQLFRVACPKRPSPFSN